MGPKRPKGGGGGGARGSSQTVPETPEEAPVGRSKRQSTAISSAATQSFLNQSLSQSLFSPSQSQGFSPSVVDSPDCIAATAAKPPRGAGKEKQGTPRGAAKGKEGGQETPRGGGKKEGGQETPKGGEKATPKGRGRKSVGSEVTIIPETPESILQGKRAKARRQSMAAILQVMEEDSQQEEEEIEMAEKERKDQEEEERKEQEAGKKVGRKGKVKEAAMTVENISRIASPAVARQSRGSPRGKSSRLSLASFPASSPFPASPLKTMDLESSSDESADESWGESVRKLLPKPLSGRKSVMISGNLKQPKKRGPKKTPSKTRKNLNPQLERLSEERNKERGKELEELEELEEQEEQELDSLPVPGRRSSGRPATKAASHVLPSTVLATIADSGGASGASRGNTPSYQNFSTDSAKDIIAKLQDSGVTPGRKRKSDSPSFPGSKKRKEEELPGSKKRREAGQVKMTPLKVKEVEDMDMATTARKPPPMRNLAILKLTEKTSLTPQPMEMTMGSPPMRRSGRDSTALATRATDSLLSPPAAPPTPLVPTPKRAPSKSMAPTPKSAPTNPLPPASKEIPKEAELDQLMKGLLVCVDYRSDDRAENTGGCLKSLAKSLGAEVCDRVRKGVTQLVFRNGHEKNFSAATKAGIPIVSMGWLEEAKKTGGLPPEVDWPSLSWHRYNSPHLFPKLKKMRSMQPKSLAEDYAKATKSVHRKAKIQEKKEAVIREAARLAEDLSPVSVPPPHEHYYKGCDDKKPHYLDELLAQASKDSPFRQSGASTPSCSVSTASSDDDFDTPLAQRLLKSRVKNRRASSPGSHAKTGQESLAGSKVDLASPGRSKVDLASPGRSKADLASSNLDTTTKARKGGDKESPRARPGLTSPSPSRRSNRASTQIVSKATEQAVLQDASPPFLELPPSPVLKKVKSRNPLGRPVLESTRLSPTKGKRVSPINTTHYVRGRGRGRGYRPLGRPVVESTRISVSPPKPKKTTQVSPLVKKIQNDILFDSLLKSPTKQAVTISPTALPAPPADSPAPLPASTAPLAPSTAPPAASPAPPPTKAVDQRSRGAAAAGGQLKKPAAAPSPAAAFRTPCKTPGQSTLPASPIKSPRLVAPWRHQDKAAEPADYEDVYEFYSFPEEPTTSSRPAKAAPTKAPAPPARPSLRRGSRSQDTSKSQAVTSPIASPAHPPESPLPQQAAPPLPSPPAPLEREHHRPVTSPNHRRSSPAANRLGSPSHRIGSPRAEHNRFSGSSPRPVHGSLLLQSSQPGSSAISLTGLASDTIVASVESLRALEEPARISAPALSSTSQAAWKSIASTSTSSLSQDPQNKPKKSALLSRIFSKPPTPKPTEAAKPVQEDVELPESPMDSASLLSTTEPTKALPKRPHKLLPQRTLTVLDQTVDPASPATLEDPAPTVPNVHVVQAAAKLEVTKKVAEKGEKVKEKTGKEKRKGVDEAGFQKEMRKRKKKESRRSSADFVKPVRSQSRQSSTSESSGSVSSSASVSGSQQATTSTKGRRAKVVLPNIVCTSCHRDDSNLVKELVRKFGMFSVSSSVTLSTTHVMSGEGKRTLNLLKGLMQGCWLITKEWAYASLEEGRWAGEEPFEMVNFSPAVRNLREERLAFPGAFKSELFKDVGTVYVSSECRAPKEELRQLVISGGGSVANTARVASVVVGEFRDGGEEGTTDCVTEKWVLDSVQFHVVMPFSDYPL